MPGAGGKGERGVSVQDDGKVLEMDGGDGCTTLRMHLIPPNLKMLKVIGVSGGLHQLSLRFLVLAQVMISWFMSSSSASGSVLTVQSLLGIFSLPVSLPLPNLCALPSPSK